MGNPSTTSPPSLLRVLGPVMGTAIVVGTVIGSGIFKKPQDVAANTTHFGFAVLVWVLGGVLALMGALAYAEVATLFPRAGGNYVFLREGYGRLAGFLWGWVEFFIIRSASIAALATLFTQSFHAVLVELLYDGRGEILGYWPQRLFTAAVILGLAYVNMRGVRWGGWLQLLITIVKVFSLLALFALPFIVTAVLMGSSEPSPINTENLAWENLKEDKSIWVLLGGLATAQLGVLWAYHGWMNIAPIAEEVKDPQRNIPIALLVGTGIVVFLYLSVNLSYALVLNQKEMVAMKASNDPDNPSRDQTVGIGFTRRLIGPLGVALASAAVMCSVFGALNGNLLVGPRLLYAMSEDQLAPRALGEVHAQYRTPFLAIFVMACWSALLVLGTAVLAQVEVLAPDKDHFDILTNFAMFGAVIFETMAVCSIFVFRRTLPDAPRPYRCWGYPWIPALYVLLPAMILVNMFFRQQVEAIVGVIFIVAGVVVYALFGRPPAEGTTTRSSSELASPK